MISKAEKIIIIDFLEQKLSPELIYVFGSYSKNNERKDSDIDIAFLSENEVDEYQIFLFAQKLADKFKKEVDLIDIKQASTVFKIQIIQGKLIYNANNYKKMEFELKTLREYANLNEKRKEVLEGVWG
ncbi:nucleotidyltransferase domain-containing protein [Iocasia frigidifontis]|uniref:Nucleotidyltransferase domain-containing protein n=1 Tax=Iocasia fonsfrigidae TaxID=2682810 RepID=A0A8A7K6L6_9FIRM|nr:nucleotidyltransferase domain-containing protein [Iocasia fonsfrigidae]QTL97423.1 nucleotidyltransferase domain-containing protein [Iocasia fonsfrigidae]